MRDANREVLLTMSWAGHKAVSGKLVKVSDGLETVF